VGNIFDLAQLIRKEPLSDLGIKHAFANVAQSQTDSEVVAAVTGKRIRVLAYHCQAGDTGTQVTFQSNSVAISSLKDNAANGGAVGNFNPLGWFETVAGESLKVTTGAGSDTGIDVGYVEVR